MTLANEISQEQKQVDVVYGALAQQISHYKSQFEKVIQEKASGTPQNRSERDAMAAYYTDQIARLEKVEHNLVFGKLTKLDGNSIYIGRVGLHSGNNEQLLIDWRAPAATAFYQATSVNPMGISTRRHIALHNRKVIGIEDELIKATGKNMRGLVLQGEGALIAALNAGRSGYMSDIVATIQAEQDKIIRSGCKEILIVQGGPGTGKTAVALHRAAYLLYEYAAKLEKSGVLIVGPSSTFLRYIQQVLPALGETGVVSTTIGNLLPGLNTNVADDPRIATLKGDLRWVQVCKQMVQSLQRPLAQAQVFRVGNHNLELSPKIINEGIRRARLTGKPHNIARETYASYVLEEMVKQYTLQEKKRRTSSISLATDSLVTESKTSQEACQEPLEDEQIAWAQADIRENIALRRAINLCWMPYSATSLLEKFYSNLDFMTRIATCFSAAELSSLVRPKGSPITISDIPIIDELEEHLGPIEAVTGYSQKVIQERAESQALQRAALAIENQGLGEGIVSPQMLKDRAFQHLASNDLIDLAVGDRSWVYGHIVVDEAQELSHLAWRMLLRRCPSRSFTIVGDLAQRRFNPVSSWMELLGPAANYVSEEAILSVCYRTPQSIMELAERILEKSGFPVEYPVRSVRDIANCIAEVKSDQLDSDSVSLLVEKELELLDTEIGNGSGRLAVIIPKCRYESLALGIAVKSDPILSRVCVITAEEAKGLEFDRVLVIEPELIRKESVSDLFVTLTRATRHITLASTTDLSHYWD